MALIYRKATINDLDILTETRIEVMVGVGGISYFQVMPTYHNPMGREAYIMNMYTKPDYWRRYIGNLWRGVMVGEGKDNEWSELLELY